MNAEKLLTIVIFAVVVGAVCYSLNRHPDTIEHIRTCEKCKQKMVEEIGWKLMHSYDKPRKSYGPF